MFVSRNLKIGGTHPLTSPARSMPLADNVVKDSLTEQISINLQCIHEIALL